MKVKNDPRSEFSNELQFTRSIILPLHLVDAEQVSKCHREQYVSQSVIVSCTSIFVPLTIYNQRLTWLILISLFFPTDTTLIAEQHYFHTDIVTKFLSSIISKWFLEMLHTYFHLLNAYKQIGPNAVKSWLHKRSLETHRMQTSLWCQFVTLASCYRAFSPVFSAQCVLTRQNLRQDQAEQRMCVSIPDWIMIYLMDCIICLLNSQPSFSYILNFVYWTLL